jgi:hypothetical protein
MQTISEQSFCIADGLMLHCFSLNYQDFGYVPSCTLCYTCIIKKECEN